MHLLAVLEAELDEVAEQEDEQQQEDDDVEVEEGQHEQVRRDRQLRRAQRAPRTRWRRPAPAGSPLMISRLRLRLPCSPGRLGVSGITGSGCGVRRLDCIHGVSAASPATRATHELIAVQRHVGAHPHVVDLVGRPARCRRASCATRSSETTRWASRRFLVRYGSRCSPLSDGDPVLLGEHVVGDLALNRAGLEQPLDPEAAVLPELDVEAHVGGDAACRLSVQGGGDGAQEDHLDGDVEVVQEHGDVADADLRFGRRGTGPPSSRPARTHTARTSEARLRGTGIVGVATAAPL